MFLRYNELRALIGSADAIDARAIVATRRAERDAARQVHPRDWVGTVTPSQLAFPYLVNWGYPERFHRGRRQPRRGRRRGHRGHRRVARRRSRASPASCMTVDEFDEVRDGDILVCQMTNPAWVVLFTKIAGLVTDTGGTTSHPAVLAREFGIPAVIGTSVATKRIRDRRPDPGRRHERPGRGAGERRGAADEHCGRRDGRDRPVTTDHPPALAGVRRRAGPAAGRRPRRGARR